MIYLFLSSLFLPGDSGSMVMVLYPENGVSPVQKALMTSADGSNVHVVGKFDK